VQLQIRLNDMCIAAIMWTINRAPHTLSFMSFNGCKRHLHIAHVALDDSITAHFEVVCQVFHRNFFMASFVVARNNTKRAIFVPMILHFAGSCQIFASLIIARNNSVRTRFHVFFNDVHSISYMAA